MLIAVCDDDKVFLRNVVNDIKNILFKINIATTIHSFTNGAELIKKVKNFECCYDIVILDIDMPNTSGMEIAKKLRELDNSFKLMFVTSMEDQVYNSFQLNTDAFIPKNKINEYLEHELKRLIDISKQSKSCMQMFEIENDYGKKITLSIQLNDIMYFESVNRTIYLHTKKGTYTLTQKHFDSIRQKYLFLNFVEIHRSCIVNIRYIFQVNEIDIKLDNDEILPLSRRQRKNVINTLSDFVDREIMYD